jgi:DNA-binding PadR family transcriptional regulator
MAAKALANPSRPIHIAIHSHLHHEGAMGYIEGRTIQSRQVMTARDYIWLAVLGAVERAPLSMDDAVQAVGALAGQAWTPVQQLVFDAIDQMLEDGLLNPVERSMRLAITGEGRRRLQDLLTQPLAAPLSSFGQVGIRLKLAFLDLAPPAMRHRQIDAILRSCDCEIASRTASCAAWSLNGILGRVWLDHQVDALEEMAEVLRRMARAEGASPRLD